jgi:hypothetical protein
MMQTKELSLKVMSLLVSLPEMSQKEHSDREGLKDAVPT